MSIVHIYRFLLGVVWSEKEDPTLSATRYIVKTSIMQLSLSLSLSLSLQMIPMDVPISVFELDGHIQTLVKNPLKSPQRERFTIRKMCLANSRYSLASLTFPSRCSI